MNNDDLHDDDTWCRGTVPLAPTSQRRYTYREHGDLNPQQEFIIFLTKIHHNVHNGFIAQRWLNCVCEGCVRVIRNIIQMWTAAMYEILRHETFWCDPDVLEFINSQLHSNDEDDTPAILRGDCSCTPMEGHKGGSKGRGLESSNGLRGHYYHTHGAKFCVVSGPNGSILAVSFTFDAGEHQ